MKEGRRSGGEGRREGRHGRQAGRGCGASSTSTPCDRRVGSRGHTGEQGLHKGISSIRA
jgi:hypothetical protein